MHRRHFIAAAASAAAIAPLAMPAMSAQAWTPGTVTLPEWYGDKMRQVAVMLRGCWAVEQVGEPDDCSFTLYHMPTKTRAAWSEDRGVMEHFAGILDSVADFDAITEQAQGMSHREKAYAAAHEAGLIRWGDCSWARA